jgi:hypothetical protein
MHPWMIEQVAREHRRDLLDRADRRPGHPTPRWRRLTAYIAMATVAHHRARVVPARNSAPGLALLPADVRMEAGTGGAAGAGTAGAGESPCPATAA